MRRLLIVVTQLVLSKVSLHFIVADVVNSDVFENLVFSGCLDHVACSWAVFFSKSFEKSNCKKTSSKHLVMLTENVDKSARIETFHRFYETALGNVFHLPAFRCLDCP